MCVCVCVTMSIALGQTTPGTNTFGPPLGHDDPAGVRSYANKRRPPGGPGQGKG